MANIAIFASGSGSNFENLVKQKEQYNVSFLFCDRKDAFAIQRAKNLGIEYRYASIIQEKENFENKILEFLEEFQVDFIVLAGYMKIIGKAILDKWEGKIINIHPSLLPKYKGANAIKEAFENNEREYGITIHYVDEGVDTGKIIAQDSFIAESNETLEEITHKIHSLEHNLYPKIINRLSKELKEKKYE